jgi:HrpA-like RNA helicase
MKRLEENQCIVLVGETGSGKTTQIPQWYVSLFNFIANALLSVNMGLLCVIHFLCSGT